MGTHPIFKKVGLVGKNGTADLENSLATLIDLLHHHHIQVLIPDHYPEHLFHTKARPIPESQIAQNVDLIIVVGGDGSFLSAARTIIAHNPTVPVVGINRGRLGFLTDISPDEIEIRIPRILKGEFQKEQRSLLQGSLVRHNRVISLDCALNDIVLYSANIAKMIEFDVFINKQFVYNQRSDGLITATATGSTAYALSAGGPIMHPKIDAWVLVPMHPHTLTARPIVIQDDSPVVLKITPNNTHLPKVSFDGQVHRDTESGDEIHIQKHPHRLTVLHPLDYDYYAMLRGKLGWNN